MWRRIVGGALAALLLAASGIRVSGQSQDAAPQSFEQRVDRIFERWAKTPTPGCAVGVEHQGQVLYARGYGLANLEYGVRIKPDTVFESGSVAKQFTSAAIALLALDGKLSRQDPVRKYVPELPDFGGAPITIQHFLNHTSGLRSQWPMLTLAGRPPGFAVHTVPEILELVSGYTELNFRPGDDYLYNNTAFTLLGVIVQRVSGTSLNAFTQERLFKPLGMTKTEWREDFAKVVPDRATAYRMVADSQFRQYMPFTNVIGNGGLLTTVGDLLKWNENLDRPKVGGQAMVDAMQTRGRLNDGFVNEYAEGLTVTDYRGVGEVSHGGSTAGYQTYLARWPGERLSVAVLCNTTGVNPGSYAHQVADLLLGPVLKPRPVARRVEAPAGALEAVAGTYRESPSDAVVRLTYDKDKQTLRVGTQVLAPSAVGVFSTGDGQRAFTVFPEPGSAEPGWPAAGTAAIRLVERDGRTRPVTLERQRPFAPVPADLDAFAGEFFARELAVTYTFYTDGNQLKLRFRPAQRLTLQPVYPDAFEADGNVYRFTRDAAGAVTGLQIYAGRVWHLKFEKRR